MGITGYFAAISLILRGWTACRLKKGELCNKRD